MTAPAGGPARQGNRKSRHTAYVARRNMLIAQGRWNPETDAGPVREHVRKVKKATGMTVAQYAAAAGVTASTVESVLYETAKKRVKTPLAARLMRVTAATKVPAARLTAVCGPMRRLQALAAAGWPPALLAELLGLHRSQVRDIRDGRQQQILPANAEKITRLYDQLWNTRPPAGTRWERTAVTRTIRHAAQKGWVPAAAWDDDQIDDPAGRPAQGWQRPPETARYRKAAETAAEARELLGFGLTRVQAAERLQVSVDALEKALARHPAPPAEQARDAA